jgi:hypothetical protein
MPTFEDSFGKDDLDADPTSEEGRQVEKFVLYLRDERRTNAFEARRYLWSLLVNPTDRICYLEVETNGSRIDRWGINGVPPLVSPNDQVTEEGTVCVGLS